MKTRDESRRLNKLKDAPKNMARHYKFPEAAVTIIRRAGRIHCLQSRVIQIAVEMLWRQADALAIPSEILDFPPTGYTYKLPPRTVGLIETLAKDYGTQGVLAACAAILSAPEPRRGGPNGLREPPTMGASATSVARQNA